MDSARSGGIALRLYGWEPGCLSFGRNQTARGRYDGTRAAERGFDVVRRPTGGRSVFHYREITYSVTAPAGSWGGLRNAYLRINGALAAGLRELGAPASVVELGGKGSAARPTVRACFRDPLPGEVVAAGRKLVGSAQWRESGALLQHGSILVHNDQATVEDLCIGSPPGLQVPAVGLAELLDPVPDLDAIAHALATAFAEELDLLPIRAELEPAERVAAEVGRSKYEDEDWTWRR